jgi:hypothetical protein
MFVITADQIDSQHEDDVAGKTVERLNDAYGLRLALPVDRNAGDEIQALSSRPETALAIVSDLTRSGDWSVGLGIGAVRTPLPANTREAAGPAFVAARRAVDRAKRASLRFALESAATEAGESAEALTDLFLLNRSRRTGEGWELFDLIASGHTQAQAATILRISPQAVSQRARAAGIHQELAAMPALVDVLSRLDGGEAHN